MKKKPYVHWRDMIWKKKKPYVHWQDMTWKKKISEAFKSVFSFISCGLALLLYFFWTIFSFIYSLGFLWGYAFPCFLFVLVLAYLFP